jgi:hypothetical protein
LYTARCQKSLQILPFVHGAMSEVSKNITICTRRDVRSLYKYYHLYMARCQKSLQILPFVHGAMSEVSTNITISTWRDVRSLYKYYHLYIERCQTWPQILPTAKKEKLPHFYKLFLIRPIYFNRTSLRTRNEHNQARILHSCDRAS